MCYLRASWGQCCAQDDLFACGGWITTVLRFFFLQNKCLYPGSTGWWAYYALAIYGVCIWQFQILFRAKLLSGEDYELFLELAHPIVAEQTTYKCYSTKVEIRAKKEEGIRWVTLELDRSSTHRPCERMCPRKLANEHFSTTRFVLVSDQNTHMEHGKYSTMFVECLDMVCSVPFYEASHFLCMQ